MDRNKEIADSIAKANYHYERRNSKNVEKNKRKYSYAFGYGDFIATSLVVHDNSVLPQQESRKFNTLYEKRAFWRGFKNGKKRHK